MSGERSGVTHGGNNRRQRHSLEKPWRKSCKKIRGGDGVRGTYSRGRVETPGAGERGFGDSGIEMGNTQVGV